MNKRFGTMAIVVATVAAAAGLFANASNSAPQPPNCGFVWGCLVTLTATGPSPDTLTMHAEGNLRFVTQDSVTHTVVFANGLCSFTLDPGSGSHGCNDPFMFYAGSYAYTVDGKFQGTVVTTPLRRSVTLTARSHTIRGRTRLTLRGRVHRSDPGTSPPPPVVVLARHNSSQPFALVATVRTRGSRRITYRWKLDVQPQAATTYIAEVTAQRLCYFPRSRCADPQGQVWADARSRPFTVRIRHGVQK
ncbi:MAG TPA: hypothetical protein VJ838_01965 [Gaiellaceae bacterium]|nr:hypothetical protein [Gaiellaceae bacterium]